MRAKLKVNNAVLDLLNEHRVIVSGISVGKELVFDDAMTAEPYSAIFIGSRLPATIGAFSYSNSLVSPAMKMGRYCSIAGGVSMVGNSHPHTWASTSPFSYGSWRNHANLRMAVEDANVKNYRALPYVTTGIAPQLGNDVWIGQDVLFNSGIKVGDGAVIAARSLVTKDVPPYAIVGGSPARVIKMRFPDDVIAEFQSVRWWQYRFTDFQDRAIMEPAAFIERIARMAQTGQIASYLPEPLRAQELIEAASAS